jgi:hypothetical protein
MPKRKKKPGRRKVGRVTVTMRLFPTTKKLLKQAAKAADLEQGRYVEKVLLAQFEREGFYVVAPETAKPRSVGQK